MLLAQTKNALERLAGTFVEGHSVDQSFGGEATTQDLARLVLCAHIACDRDVKRSNDIVSEADSQALMPSFLKAISAVLPDIVSVLKAEPDATALERAGEPAYTLLSNIAYIFRDHLPGRGLSHFNGRMVVWLSPKAVHGCVGYQVSGMAQIVCLPLTWPSALPADAAEASKVARHENSMQRSEASSERRGREDRNQDMRPGKSAHIALVSNLVRTALLCQHAFKWRYAEHVFCCRRLAVPILQRRQLCQQDGVLQVLRGQVRPHMMPAHDVAFPSCIKRELHLLWAAIKSAAIQDSFWILWKLWCGFKTHTALPVSSSMMHLESLPCVQHRPESAGPVRGRGRDSFGGDRFASNDSNSKPGAHRIPLNAA